VPELNLQYRAHPHPRLILGDSQPSQLDRCKIYLVRGIRLSVLHHPTEDSESQFSQTMASGKADGTLTDLKDSTR
jgi:hypothetical protein